MRLFSLLLLLAACGKDDDSPSSSSTSDTATGSLGVDADGDGYAAANDCDDTDPFVYPGAVERCDGVDSDCNPTTTEDGVISMGNETFDNPQQAIDASEAGAVVSICTSSIAGALTIPHDLTLWGPGGAANTTLQGSAAAPVIEVAAGTFTLEGVTLSGGGGERGGGLAAVNAEAVVLRDVVFADNTAVLGGGAFFSAGGASLESVRFTDNVAEDYGGGFAVEAGGVVTASGTTLTGNSADYGGAVFAYQGAHISGIEASGNNAESGAGVYLWTATLSDSSFTGNSAVNSGGGVYVCTSGELHDLIITGNDALLGGGIATLDGVIDATNVSVDGNTATSQGGGLLVNNTVWTGSGLVVSNNTSDDLGGGLFLRDGHITGGTVEDNTAMNGGGAYLSSLANAGTLADMTFRNNAADETGGGILALSTAVLLDTCDVLDNTSGVRGGGVYASNSAVVTIDGAHLNGNVATEYGGGLYLNSLSVGVVSNTTIDRNIAARGAGVYIGGAAQGDISDSAVVSNGDLTTISGGGIRITDGGATLSSVDLGTGISENAPDDVYTVGSTTAYLNYGTGTSISCTQDGCI
ncbi:MAG: hypothetical protein GWP91_21875 [Rhodobacterales bacterium]|nr:hypothetical protein [Rhodobacterales bacterium]